MASPGTDSGGTAKTARRSRFQQIQGSGQAEREPRGVLQLTRQPDESVIKVSSGAPHGLAGS